MTTREQLDDRYGRTPRPGRTRALWVIVGVLAVVTIAVGSWITVSTSATTVRADDTAMRVIDDRTVEVSFQVSGPRDREIACAIEALEEEFGVVGWRIVVLPPSDQHTRAFTETIPTISPATTGLVNSCWVT